MMTDQEPNVNPESAESWQEVGRQFQALGEGLASLMRSTWENETNRQHLRKIESDLTDVVESVGRVVSEKAASPEAQQLREEALRAVGTLRSAGEQAVSEARPHLLSALKQVNEELQRMVERMEGRKD